MSDAIVGRRRRIGFASACAPCLARRFALVIALSLLWPGRLLAGGAGEAWVWMHTRAGITSWQTERRSQELAAFRAEMLLEADLWTALAILEDIDRACEWTSHCAEMRRLREVSARELLVYARIDAPWPVRDRDVVVRVEVSYGERGEVLLSIHETGEGPREAASDIVRMPRFQAHYRFRVVDARHTRVEYQVDVDPGGTLPDWLKRMIARDLSHDTLADLRKRAGWALARGEYEARKVGLASMARSYGFVPLR